MRFQCLVLVKLERLLLSERSQTQRATYCVPPFTRIVHSGRSQRETQEAGGCWDWGWEELGLPAGTSFWGRSCFRTGERRPLHNVKLPKATEPLSLNMVTFMFHEFHLNYKRKTQR